MLVSNQQEWDVVSGLFDDGYVPDGWIKEDLDEGLTTSQRREPIRMSSITPTSIGSTAS